MPGESGDDRKSVPLQWLPAGITFFLSEHNFSCQVTTCIMAPDALSRKTLSIRKRFASLLI